MTDWYEQMIEEPIKDLVFLLRNNGFNTTCSCGHDMTVEMEYYSGDDIERLHDLLIENGYTKFIIHVWWETYPCTVRSMQLHMGE